MAAILKIVSAITPQPIVLFQWNFAWEAVFLRISAMGQLPVFHRTYF